MILGSRQFFQKSVKWYIVIRVAGIIGAPFALAVFWICDNHERMIGLAILLALPPIWCIWAIIVWLNDRIRYGF